MEMIVCHDIVSHYPKKHLKNRGVNSDDKLNCFIFLDDRAIKPIIIGKAKFN